VCCVKLINQRDVIVSGSSSSSSSSNTMPLYPASSAIVNGSPEDKVTRVTAVHFANRNFKKRHNWQLDNYAVHKPLYR